MTFRLIVENAGGGTLQGAVRPWYCSLQGGEYLERGTELASFTPLDPNAVSEQFTATCAIKVTGAFASLTANLSRTADEERVLGARAFVLAVDPETLPAPSGERRVGSNETGAVIEDELISLYLPRLRGGCLHAVVRARKSPSSSWTVTGILGPLADMAMQRDALCSAAQVGFTPRVDDGLLLTMGHRQLRFAFGPKPGLLKFEANMTAEDDLEVLRFAGPRYLAGEGAPDGPARDAALFPGIEYLNDKGRSSDVESAGTYVGFRHTPVPLEVTVPLMAVVNNGICTGLMWNALDPWHGENNMPMATFAAPNFLHEQDNTLMQIFAPGYPTWMTKNARLAHLPYHLPKWETMSLSGHLFAVPEPDVAMAVPLWYEVYSTPAPPKLAKSLDENLHVLMRGWAETMYEPDKDAVTNHWRHGLTPGPAGWLKARMLAYAQETGAWDLADRMGVKPENRLSQYLGSTFAAVAAQSPPKEALESQRPDGTWGYHCGEKEAERAREFTQGKHDTLGREGDTNAGLCAVQAAKLLSYALSTGDHEYEAAGLRALEAINRFQVPAGAQTWEVHMDAPDIYGSTLAIQCNMLGYRLTGKRTYLDQATRWAYSGLPFLYAYQVPGTGPGAQVVIPGDPLTDGPDPMEGTHPASVSFEEPDRHITPYGSIPVFGTSFYMVRWFGVLVQWCGLRWATEVFDLLEEVDDPLLRAAAEGVTISGCQQTFDKGVALGCLPDGWILDQNRAVPAYIGPVVAEGALRKLLDRPTYSDVTTEVLHQETARVQLSTRDVVSDAALGGEGITWSQRHLTGHACETVLTGVPRPTAVSADGQPLPEQAVQNTESVGWEYLADAKRLLIRTAPDHEGVPTEPTETVRIQVRLP